MFYFVVFFLCLNIVFFVCIGTENEELIPEFVYEIKNRKGSSRIWIFVRFLVLLLYYVFKIH